MGYWKATALTVTMFTALVVPAAVATPDTPVSITGIVERFGGLGGAFFLAWWLLARTLPNAIERYDEQLRMITEQHSATLKMLTQSIDQWRQLEERRHVDQNADHAKIARALTEMAVAAGQDIAKAALRSMKDE
jgi:hypothetical protein